MRSACLSNSGVFAVGVTPQTGQVFTSFSVMIVLAHKHHIILSYIHPTRQAVFDFRQRRCVPTLLFKFKFSTQSFHFPAFVEGNNEPYASGINWCAGWSPP